MKALVLAAGYAVRLKELTQDRPKPLLKIGGRPIIERIIDKIADIASVDQIHIVTNAKFYGGFEGWLKNFRHAIPVALLNDGSISNETRLGAIKDIDFAISQKKIDDDLLIIAGDNLFEFNLKDFIAFAVKKNGISLAAYDIKDLAAASRFGVVKVDGTGRIVDFEEKPISPKSTLVSTGIYYFPKDKIALIGRYLKNSEKNDAPGYCISWLSKNDRVYGFIFSEDWYDIGDVTSYKKADSDYLKKER